MGYVVGQDIGYSNLKIAFGTSDGEMTTVIRPAGAAPKDILVAALTAKAG